MESLSIVSRGSTFTQLKREGNIALYVSELAYWGAPRKGWWVVKAKPETGEITPRAFQTSRFSAQHATLFSAEQGFAREVERERKGLPFNTADAPGALETPSVPSVSPVSKPEAVTARAVSGSLGVALMDFAEVAREYLKGWARLPKEATESVALIETWGTAFREGRKCPCGRTLLNAVCELYGMRPDGPPRDDAAFIAAGKRVLKVFAEHVEALHGEAFRKSLFL